MSRPHCCCPCHHGATAGREPPRSPCREHSCCAVFTAARINPAVKARSIGRLTPSNPTRPAGLRIHRVVPSSATVITPHCGGNNISRHPESTATGATMLKVSRCSSNAAALPGCANSRRRSDRETFTSNPSSAYPLLDHVSIATRSRMRRAASGLRRTCSAITYRRDVIPLSRRQSRWCSASRTSRSVHFRGCPASAMADS